MLPRAARSFDILGHSPVKHTLVRAEAQAVSAMPVCQRRSGSNGPAKLVPDHDKAKAKHRQSAHGCPRLLYSSAGSLATRYWSEPILPCIVAYICPSSLPAAFILQKSCSVSGCHSSNSECNRLLTSSAMLGRIFSTMSC